MGTPVPRWTRRTFLLSGAAAWGLDGQPSAKGTIFDRDWRRYSDPTTEFEVLRLTNPEYTSQMPAYYTRPVARHNGFLLFSCDRTGSLQVFRMDLKTGQTRQLTNATELDAGSVALMPDDRAFCYFDGESLRQTTINSLREREIYKAPAGWKRTPGASLSSDGLRMALAESDGTACRLRLVALARGSAETVVEAGWTMTDALLHPRRAQILYRQGDEALWLVNTDGKQNRKLKLADGHIGPARWSPDGKTVLYLHLPDDPKQLHAIREHTPDQNLDKLVAKTSQFAHFGCNANGSVFAGASQNKASPTILLLLRITRRELTMCEHRASDPQAVAPIFSPDSQRIYFHSDRDGKRAIYMLRVDKFVEQTDT
jgi:Tol biopolymer transport system component